MGAGVGDWVGAGVGAGVGDWVGAALGIAVGDWVGDTVFSTQVWPLVAQSPSEQWWVGAQLQQSRSQECRRQHDESVTEATPT